MCTPIPHRTTFSRRVAAMAPVRRRPSPATWSTRTWSKFTVIVRATLSPIWISPTGVVPVLAAQAFTILVPSRYRSQVPAAPTVPHSSSSRHPVPIAVEELCWVPATSERTSRVPEAFRKTLATGPLAAVRSRSRSIAVPPWVVTFTFMLMHTCEKVPVSSLVAKALWAVTCARAEGAAGLPVP